MRLSRFALSATLLAALPMVLAACGASLTPPPEYAWVFDVSITPSGGDCVDDPGSADSQSFTYGVVVAGDTVEIYSDDAKLADGTLTGKHIGYSSPAPFTERRQNENGEPVEIEWTLSGHVDFLDQDLTESEDGEETITIFGSEVDDIETGCTHASVTEWRKR